MRALEDMSFKSESPKRHGLGWSSGLLAVLLSCSPAILGFAATRKKAQADIRRVVVVCLHGHAQFNRQIESQLVPHLKRKGLDVLSGDSAFKSLAKFTPKSFVEQMRRLRVDGLMLAEPSQMSVVPKRVRFKYYATTALQPKVKPDEKTLDDGLRAFLIGERP